MATNGAAPPADQTGSSPNNNLGKDEVAWFFVEQYYTTLSKTPEKLHLFYGKRSQFVYGQEAEVAGVSVGRHDIQQRIKSLDFSDSCKVRITNVDSMKTDDSILIQVIGETCKKAGEDPKKFVQTFILAQQPSGYFVLNDILRYIDDEDVEEEQPQETAGQEAAVALPQHNSAPEVPEEPETAAKPEAVAEERAASAQLDPEVVDEKLEEVAAKETPATDSVVETTAEPTAAAQEPTETNQVNDARPDSDKASQELAAEDSKVIGETPAEPKPTRAATQESAPPAAAPAAAPAPSPSQPPKPKTWASLAAAGAKAASRPAPALPKAAVTPAPAAAAAPQPRPAVQNANAAAPAQPVATPPQPAEAPANSAPTKDNTEWQTAGNESKRHNRPQSISGAQEDKAGALGYVKYVTEKVNADDLRTALQKHGEVVYFDVNRQKSCAFVEFATTAGYQAAAAANPHTVNGEQIVVEARRPKTGAYGGANYNANRGGMTNRGGRGGFDGRTGGQGGRGGFQNRGRGGSGRGRGGMQTANA